MTYTTIHLHLTPWAVIGKRTIGQAIREQADATGANLIVVGAFGHSRLQESVLGGATRELLNKSTIPLLMSH